MTRADLRPCIGDGRVRCGVLGARRRKTRPATLVASPRVRCAACAAKRAKRAADNAGAARRYRQRAKVAA